jgi:hypothetical protein
LLDADVGANRFWHNAISLDAGARGCYLARKGEKVAPFGDQLRRLTAVAFVVLGVALQVHPTFVTHLIC